MMLGGRKKSHEQSESLRQKIIAYKKVFGTPEGKEVLFDLCNRFHILNGHGGDPHKEGQRSVVLDILGNTHRSMEEFDKLLKGEM